MCYRILGSLAAGIQAGIGSVAAGSLFATVQGIAMGAAMPAVIPIVGGAVLAAVGWATVWLTRKTAGYFPRFASFIRGKARFDCSTSPDATFKSR